MAGTAGKVRLAVPLAPREVEFLAAQTAAYELPSEAKALRCCVNWAAQAAAVGAPPALDVDTPTPQHFDVAASQLEYLESLAQRWEVEPGVAARATVVAAMRVVADDVFGTIRCKSKTTCPHYLGAT
mmetsp:Transcript_17388/g.54305  ORF Transcript_17388/g.54305 Transcript_17388/m.54305 type:complete len:127 (-) Transcript_17388:496-876(-)